MLLHLILIITRPPRKQTGSDGTAAVELSTATRIVVNHPLITLTSVCVCVCMRARVRARACVWRDVHMDIGRQGQKKGSTFFSGLSNTICRVIIKQYL